MNKLIITLFGVMLTVASCSQGNNTATEPTGREAFVAFAEHFSENEMFAYANVGDREVLLVSQEVFGNNVNEDKEAIEATIFAQDEKGKIVSLGSIRSQGTAYPVSVLDGKLMVAGHRFVRIYSIRGDVPELVLDSYGEGEGPEMPAMFETFGKGNSIKFNKKP